MKIKSLAAEAGIIRAEERRHRDEPWMRESLRRHRTEDVRREQRASLLAYAFLRGRSYAATEPKPRVPPRMGRIVELVHVFLGAGRSSKQEVANAVQAWLRHTDLCGQDQGVMTPGAAGSTPAVCSMPG